MKKNVGTADSIIRLIIGVIIIIIGIAFGSWWGAIGLILIITALLKWCPLYPICGISTCKVEEVKAEPEAKPEEAESKEEKTESSDEQTEQKEE